MPRGSGDLHGSGYGHLTSVCGVKTLPNEIHVNSGQVEKAAFGLF